MDLIEPNLKALDIDVEYRGVEQCLNTSEACLDFIDVRFQRVHGHTNLRELCRVKPNTGWLVRRKH